MSPQAINTVNLVNFLVPITQWNAKQSILATRPLELNQACLPLSHCTRRVDWMRGTALATNFLRPTVRPTATGIECASIASPATSHSCRRTGRSTTRFSRRPTTSDRYGQQAVTGQFIRPLDIRPLPTICLPDRRAVFVSSTWNCSLCDLWPQ